MASSLFPSYFPSSDADSHVVHLSASLGATDSLQPYHIGCKLTRLPICHCDAASGSSHTASTPESRDGSEDGGGSLSPSSSPTQLWASAVVESSAAIASLLDEQYRPEKHKLSHHRTQPIATARQQPVAADGTTAADVTSGMCVCGLWMCSVYIPSPTLTARRARCKTLIDTSCQPVSESVGRLRPASLPHNPYSSSYPLLTSSTPRCPVTRRCSSVSVPTVCVLRAALLRGWLFLSCPPLRQ